jgi:cytochrome c-type biogenesis protein
LAFAFGWTPCIGPILGAILTMSAVGGTTSGIALLAIYSIGMGVPFLVAAVFLDRFLKYRGGLRRWGRWLHVIAGAVMILMGIAMITGRLTAFSYWLLQTFPLLGTIG